MVTLKDVKKFVEENCDEISKEDFWATYNWEFKGVFNRHQYHYQGFHYDFGGVKVWVHSSDKGAIISIGNRFFQDKGFDEKENLNAYFNKLSIEELYNKAINDK